MKLLKVENFSVTYKSGDRKVKALNNFSIEINEGESLGIVGESGSGKTTLIMAMLRLIPKESVNIKGNVFLDGKEIMSLSKKELKKVRWQEMSLVFQKSMNAFSPVHRIGSFMSDIYRVHKKETYKDEASNRVKELLKLVNLTEDVYKLYPHELSGGMMQRVNIALSLMFSPKLLILDEATSALDVVTQNQILDEVLTLEDKLGITRIMITHDMSVVASSCKNVAVLYAGNLMETGKTDEVLVEPLHPYTKGLIKSFPEYKSGKRQKLQSIKGSLPDLSSPPKGCVFESRCDIAKNICKESEPKLKNYGKGHLAACHFAGGVSSV